MIDSTAVIDKTDLKRHHDIQPNDTQHNDTHHKVLICENKHK
jgi:hypothetical protein